MKRNLSSHAVKAMAIGMAVMLGSTTAISGVVKGSVVEAYAADDATAPTGITNGTTDLATNDYVITSSGLLFKVDDAGTGNASEESATAGTATLVGTLAPNTWNAATGNVEQPFGASLQNGVLTINTNSKYFKLNITKISNNESSKKLTEIGGDILSNATTKVTTIDNNAFKGVTITGDLNLPALTTLTGTPFAGTDSDSNKGVTITGSLVLPNSINLAANEFKYTDIKNLDLSNITGTTNTTAFTNATIDTLKLPNEYVGVANAFANATIKNLDLSNVTGSIVTETFNTANIENLIHNGTALMKGSTISNLKFKSSLEEIAASVFEQATIPNEVILTGIKTLKDKSFAIANSNASSVQNAVTIKMPNLETNVNGSNIDQKLPAGTFGESGGKHIKLILPGEISDEVVTELNQPSGSKKFNNENVLVSKEVIVLPQSTDGIIENNAPTEIKFELDKELSTALGNGDKNNFEITVTGGSTQTYAIKEVNGGDSTANKVVTITLDKPIEYGQTIELKYTGNKINIEGITITNKVAPSKEQTVEVTKGNDKYTFKVTSSDSETKTVALSGFEKIPARKGRARRDLSRQNSFDSGKVNVNDVEYTLTKIGTGAPLTNIDDEALKGHTAEVTEIADKAFEGNKVITNVDFKAVTKVGNNAFANTEKVTTVNLPNVTTVGSGAFANSSVRTVDLGSEVSNSTYVSIPSDAFKGASNVTSIKTNDNSSSKNNAVSAANGSSSSNVTVGSGNSSTEVKPGGGSGSSSGGSSSSGGGANIGTSTDNSNTNNNNQNQNNNNNSNVTTPVVEDKQLSLDVISLPSVEGEAKSFGDISSDYWAKAHIDKLSTAGIINGIDGSFQPNGQTKRADVTIMIVKLLGLSPQNNDKFTDVNANAYYAPYVGAASTYGIVNGSNGMFNPEGIISRQDTMVMIGQILKSLNLNVNTDATSLTQFNDLSKVAPYAQESVAILVNSGIITGNNGKLNPTAPVTRAEMATIMSKLYDVLNSANK